MQVPAPSRKIKFDDSRGRLEIFIPSRPNISIALTQGLCGLLWALGEKIIFDVFVEAGKDPSFSQPEIIFFIIGGLWTLWGALIMLKFLRALAGTERIVLDLEYLHLKREIFGYGYNYKYKTKRISNMRVNYSHYHPLVHGIKEYILRLKAGAIEFDWGDGVRRFAYCVDETEARQIIDELCKRSNFDKAG